MSRRIAILASEILGMQGTGGAATADSLLAVALARYGHEVEVLVAPGRRHRPLTEEWARVYDEAGVRIRPLPGRSKVRPPYLEPAAEMLAALRDQPPDVVIADDWRGLGYAALRARQLGRALEDTAFVVHCHGPARVLAAFAQKVPDTLARFGDEVAERAAIELADAVVSPSEWLLDWMRAHHWPVPESARVIQYVRQSIALDEKPTRAEPGTPIRRLAFFGQLREGKGIRIYLEALEALEADLLDGIELLFLGRETPRWTAERILDSLSTPVQDRIVAIRFETGLERADAIAELTRPGTLAVVPSLLDNSPNTVSECLEHGVPFVSTTTGGIPELVAEEDRDRVLCEPTSSALRQTLERVLRDPASAVVRLARDPRSSLAAWLELVEGVRAGSRRAVQPAHAVTIVTTGEQSAARARRLAEVSRLAKVDVVLAASRDDGLARSSADWVVFLDDEDAPDDTMIDVLVSAQAASAADIVTAGVRPADDPDGLQLFLGDPGALGLVENQYGVVALIRRELVAGGELHDDAVDPEWPLLADVALRGGRIVSLPDAVCLHHGHPGSVGDVPGDGLTVLEIFEQVSGVAHHGLPQLAATLAAASARAHVSAARPLARSPIERALAVLRDEGPAGLARRGSARLGTLRTRSRRRRPATLPSRAESLRLRFGIAVDRRDPVHFLHLGKTGGTALKQALLEYGDGARYRLLLHGHDVTLAQVPLGERFMFIVRDPLSRFVSAFNGRLREDRPRYFYPWRPEERAAFELFNTPDELANALSSADAAVRRHAEEAMRGIGHVNTSYWSTFGDEEALRARLDDLFFIAFQERLDEDFELVKRKLGLSQDAHLPSNPTVAHRTPAAFPRELGDVARRNLEGWYEDDLQFVELCRRLAPVVNRAS